MYQRHIVDEHGIAHGMQQVHPLAPPHPMSKGFMARKSTALHGHGGVSRADPHLDHSNASMPWDSVQLPMPARYEPMPIPMEEASLGRVQHPHWWDHHQYAPDHSKHPIENRGDIAFMYETSPFFFLDRQ